MEPKTRLLVGLGNPTTHYYSTRHNAGRLFIEYLLKESGESFKTVRQADVFRLPNFFGVPLEKPLICAQLHCFMNESGGPVKSLLEKENIKVEETMIVYDDFMIPFGALRFRTKGSAGGHNGIKSLLGILGSEEFGRLRIGIGPLPEGEIFTDFVLEKFSFDEKKKLPLIFDAAKEGLKILFQSDINKAQGFMNKKHL